ncbi:Unknown protein sequence [Pseudomonas syringae pv. rhaphiolepidis]|nr:Unknown protein sequence [Pseudomonas syringae pv. rhaphiolepidis]
MWMIAMVCKIDVLISMQYHKMDQIFRKYCFVKFLNKVNTGLASQTLDLIF